ncbi:gliding motility-associated C-terminal domain-containing protein [Flavobacteriales bacterium]|nr:gliding motility-associated C-terminal domain-containing protein [Flavobacteriales bacterium]
MKRLIYFLILILWSFQLFAQISATTEDVNCYNDSGSVFLVFDPTITILSIDWQYSPYIIIDWIDVNVINTPFANLNSFQDSLRTTQCGWYKAIYTFDNGFQIYIDSLQWPLSCPITMGQGLEPILCYGDSSGVLKRPVFGGVPFVDTIGDEYYYYEWIFSEDSIGTNSYYFLDTTHTLTNVSAGWYKTIVTDSIGCTDTIGFIEFKNPPLIIVDTTFKVDLNCRNINTGKIGFQISGGKKYDITNKYFYYLILEGDTVGFSDTTGISGNFSHISSSLNMQSYYKDSIQFDSLMAGEYFLHVVDFNSCLMIDTILVSQPPPYEIFSSTTFPLVCESDSGYLRIDSVLYSGNINLGFLYDTINGIHIDSIYVPSGWYDIYIEDLDFGCIDTIPVRCYAQYEIEVYETIIPVYCFGESTGSILIDSITGGNLPYDVQWGSVNSSSLSSGTYSVNIVDSIGCLHTEVYFIHQSNEVNPNETLYNPSCYGIENGSIAIDLSGGTGTLNYYWLNGIGTADSLYGLSSGLYSLVVSDSLMCLDTFNISLLDPDTLVISAENYQALLSCFGALTTVDLLISGGTSPYSILWNDGDTNQQRIVGADYYSVMVTDTNECTTPDIQIIISEPDSLSISIISTNITCIDPGMASVVVSGGVSPISYLWSTGDTVQTIDSLWGSEYSNSTYWVIVTDSCGNSATDTIYFAPYELLTNVYYDEITHIATVEIVDSSSLGPFTHEWHNISGNSIGNGEFSPALCEGIYLVITTDISNNCLVIDTIDVVFDLSFGGVVDVTNTTVYSDLDLWGFYPYSYLWSTGDTTQHANICPGFHWVEVTDKDNCTVREDFQIEELIITLDPASAIIECDLENLDVDLEASATGGIAPYSFEWWNGTIDNPINLGMNPGTFSVTVIDDNGCIKDTSFFIATISAECVPNVFSPNGDDINDTWSLEDTFLYSDSQVRVYGRYGKLLFQSDGYHEAWDGTNRKGNEVPDGAYFYSIEIGHGFDPIEGTVTILRGLK